MKKNKNKQNKNKQNKKLNLIINNDNKEKEIYNLDDLTKNNEIKDFSYKTDLKQVFEELLKADNIKDVILKTELSQNDGNQFCISLALAERNKFDFLKVIIFNWLCSRISNNRQGRKELVEISLNALIQKILADNIQNKISNVKQE